MPDTQALYETLGRVSADMVEAARANDWDRLTELDRQMTAAREALARQPESGTPDDATLLRRAALITTILENNREVRRHVDPWMASARRLLTSGERERSVRAAYGVAPR